VRSDSPAQLLLAAGLGAGEVAASPCSDCLFCSPGPVVGVGDLVTAQIGSDLLFKTPSAASRVRILYRLESGFSCDTWDSGNTANRFSTCALPVLLNTLKACKLLEGKRCSVNSAQPLGHPLDRTRRLSPPLARDAALPLPAHSPLVIYY
jgi:hypothetical protein